MRHALIMAGGTGTRLWPMSVADQPKQLIPFINGKSLLEISSDRLEGLVPEDRRYICAGQAHRQPTSNRLPDFDPDRFLAEPTGRDTLNAVGFGAAIIGKHDPDAIIAVFTADHLIEPVDKFQSIVESGFALVEKNPQTLVTFGITPTHAAKGYGYLKLGDALSDSPAPEARVVDEFKEKPKEPPGLAEEFFNAGPEKYLWNSGMFVWRASTLLDCIKRYKPKVHEGLMHIADAWDTDRRQAVLDDVYPQLEKISVDYAVMEPASKDEKVTVVAVPMPLQWLDVGSWPAFAETLSKDDHGNAVTDGPHELMETSNTLVASSDPDHLVATLGVEDLIIVHTPKATLVCRADQAEKIKELHGIVKKKDGGKWV